MEEAPRSAPPLALRGAERAGVAAIRSAARLLRGSFTAGCVCRVRDPRGRILLVKPRYRLGWGLPGGFLRRDEQPGDAVRRELREEIGLDLAFDAPRASYVQGRQRHIEFVFDAALGAAQVARVAPTSLELSRLGWFADGSLPPLQPEADEALGRLRRLDAGGGAPP